MDRRPPSARSAGCALLEWKTNRVCGQGVALRSYPGAKVSWCTLGTKAREMGHCHVLALLPAHRALHGLSCAAQSHTQALFFLHFQ